MEKKLTRVQKWLERCAKACSAGSWRSALLDVECAKAELEEVRGEIWSRAEEKVSKRSAENVWLHLAKVSCLSLVLLFALSAPIATPVVSMRPVHISDATSSFPEPVLEWVTGDEQAVLAALRKSMSDANREWIAAKERGKKITEEESLSDARFASILPFAEPSAGRGAEKEKTSPRRNLSGQDSAIIEERPSRRSSTTGELDSIIHLVQIGQRALRGKESPIEIQLP